MYINNGGVCMCGDRDIQISVPSAQLCWEPKTSLNNKVLKKKKLDV